MVIGKYILFLSGVLIFFSFIPGAEAAKVTDTVALKTEIRKLDTLDINWLEKEIKARRLISQSNTIGYREGALHASYIVATSLFFRQEYKAAYALIDSMLVVLESSDTKGINNISDKRARLFAFLGTICDEIGNYGKAMEFYIKALNVVEPGNDKYQKAVLYKNLGMTNLAVNNISIARDYFSRALKICAEISDKKTVFDIYYSMQDHYINVRNYDSALISGFKLLSIAKEVGDDYNYALANNSLGNIYRKSGHTDLAKAYLAETVKFSRKNKNSGLAAEALISLSSIEIEQGNHSKALVLAQEAWTFSSHTDIIKLKLMAAEILYKCYAAVGNYKSAYEYSGKYQEFKEKEIALNNARHVLDLQARYELDKIQQEKSVLESQLLGKKEQVRQQRNAIIIASLGMILLIASLILFVWKFRYMRQLNQKLKQQGNIIKEQELVLHQEKEQALRFEIEHKNREMTSIALSLAHENEFKQELIEELQKLRSQLPAKNSEVALINSIILSIRKNISSNSWEEFRTYFENVYCKFYSNLEEAYPSLSQNDKRLCAMLKLGMSTKEISLLTCREVKSVESARNRLRKKFSLDPKDNLATFLSRF